MKQHIQCLCGKGSIYTWRNKLVPLEVYVGREGRREETGWGSWTSAGRGSRGREDKRKRRKEECPMPGQLQDKQSYYGRIPFPTVNPSCSVTKPAG